MKNTFYLLLILLLMVSSCEEQAPSGLDLGRSKVVDSSYLAPLEQKQDKVVLIEELTGVYCPNCPEAGTIIKGLIANNPERVLVTAMHPPAGKGLTEPIFNKSKFDFRHVKVDELGKRLNAAWVLPAAAVDRVKDISGDFFNRDKNTWVTYINRRLQESTPVNISLESFYSSDNNNCEVVIKSVFTEDVPYDVFITVYVIENDIKDYQQDGSDFIADYKHEHVFRECITPIAGSSLNFADKTAGTVLQKRINFAPNIEGVNSWNLDNCHILAFVHKSGAEQAVLHAAEVELK